ncbi:ribonuclease T2 [Elephas maximus indicus]|uniref:ribonuclease T2 n=1 Tax=Elephas maximus indicus TaxID=99487 RepID=UPI002116DA53|nr:ribonuclease T2 [Elephas maximus indicus]
MWTQAGFSCDCSQRSGRHLQGRSAGSVVLPAGRGRGRRRRGRVLRVGVPLGVDVSVGGARGGAGAAGVGGVSLGVGVSPGGAGSRRRRSFAASWRKRGGSGPERRDRGWRSGRVGAWNLRKPADADFNTMKLKVIYNILLCSFCLALYCLCNADKFLRDSNGSGMGWKKLIMVHHWPPTVCKEAENDCSNPPDYWTIHGLWADKAEDCNRSWHFNLEEIKDLLPEMKMYWPDVIHRSPNCSHFWKHEWEKHGTCVAQLAALSSEKKYFSKILDLYKQLDLNSVLQKLGIKPSLNYYQIADIKDALASIYGVMPKVQCLPPEKNEDVQTIGQIELCFTKDLVLENCTHPGFPASLKQKARWADEADSAGLEVCADGPAFYPPPPRETRR